MRGELARLRVEVGELVAKHERARDIADFSHYENDPAGFMRDVLRCEPWEMQVEMAERVRDHPRVVVVTANGIGKDFVTARIALWWVFARRGFVVLTGPTERQVKQILMREVRRAFAAAPELPGELYAMELRVDEDSGVLAFTSDQADKLTGYHHPRLLIAMTEGQGVGEEAYEAAQACVTGSGNRLFVYGNPTRPAGPFYRVAHADSWSVLRIGADQHPNVKQGREEIPGAVSREWIQSMRDEYGEGSSVYRSRVLAQFPEESIEGLIRRDWLRAAFARYEARTLAESMDPPVLALDPARYGPDASALAVVRGRVVERLLTWRGTSLVETADRVMALGRELEATERHHRAPMAYVDEPGLGGGVIDLLRARGYPVRAFNGGAQPSDFSGRFLNMRAQAHWGFRTQLENGVVAIAPDALLEEEALACEWTVTPAGSIQIVSKDLMRKELGRSPDRLDAVVIGLGAVTGLVGHAAHLTRFAM